MKEIARPAIAAGAVVLAALAEFAGAEQPRRAAAASTAGDTGNAAGNGELGLKERFRVCLIAAEILSDRKLGLCRRAGGGALAIEAETGYQGFAGDTAQVDDAIGTKEGFAGDATQNRVRDRRRSRPRRETRRRRVLQRTRSVAQCKDGSRCRSRASH